MRSSLKAAVTIATAVAAGAILTTTASAAPQSLSADLPYPCGHHTNNGSAYYGHCGPTDIRIRADYVSGGYTHYCVRANSNSFVGPTSVIRWSQYVDTNVSPQCHWLNPLR
ncbi:DUF6355 family natural product biosynthesis protein [Allokutzneria sp. NRRL B-24872]|uniref:DUF6355 family natural product biosynthesis protein n=1 Tax=Allokutzneria sp. NRRL B-24872 TaxID=1137961 RepID=UPI00352F89CA